MNTGEGLEVSRVLYKAELLSKLFSSLDFVNSRSRSPKHEKNDFLN